MQSHKQHARRRARTAQLACGVGLAGALAVAVLPLHGALTKRADLADTRGPVDPAQTQGPALEPLDKGWVTNFFAKVGPEALPPIDAPVDPATASNTPEPPPIDPGPGDDGDLLNNTRWQYLGSITTSRGRSAVLRDTQQANKQHLVREGREVEGFTVQRITGSHVVLSDSKGQTKVDLAPVSSSWSAPSAAPPVRTTAALQAQQRNNARVNPALASRARAGRTDKQIEPEVARQLREELMRGNMDLEKLNSLQRAGVIDETTAEELVVQFKETQGLSEKELEEMRGKVRQ